MSLSFDIAFMSVSAGTILSSSPPTARSRRCKRLHQFKSLHLVVRVLHTEGIQLTMPRMMSRELIQWDRHPTQSRLWYNVYLGDFSWTSTSSQLAYAYSTNHVETNPWMLGIHEVKHTQPNTCLENKASKHRKYHLLQCRSHGCDQSDEFNT